MFVLGGIMQEHRCEVKLDTRIEHKRWSFSVCIARTRQELVAHSKRT